MRREIVRWLVLGVALVLGLGAVASGQEEGTEDAAAAVVQRILEDVAAQGGFADQKEYVAKVLKAVQAELGPEHPEVLRLLAVMANAAFEVYKQGDYTGARGIFKEVLAVQRRVLGDEHSDTLTVMNNLAVMLRKEGEYPEAQKRFEEVLATRSRVQGEEHPDTLNAMNNLAESLREQKDLDGARRLYEKILEIRRSIFGPDREADTIEELLTLNNLAHVYRDISEPEKSVEFFLQALDALEAQTGKAGDSEDVKSVFKAQHDDIYRITLGLLYLEEAAETWIGPDATEDRAKALSKDVDVVHFAVHGVADPDHPLDSFLAFTIPDEPAEGRDNGLLQVWEIFESVRLDAELVVLSACQTALGERRGGEGIISLSRAFQYAGARTVAASLWSVDDASTAELMIRFYRYLKDGMSKDEALRAAQIELIRGGPIEVVNQEGEVVEEDYSAPGCGPCRRPTSGSARTTGAATPSRSSSTRSTPTSSSNACGT